MKDLQQQRTVELIRCDTVEIQPIDWVWEGFIASRCFTILAGPEGCGKTQISLSLAATLTVGGLWPDGARATPGAVVFWSGEDDLSYTLKPRLLAAGGNEDRLHFVGCTVQGSRRRAFNPSIDTDPLRDAIEAIGGCRLIVVDPIVCAVSGDSNSNGDVRRGLQPLIELAADLNAGLLGITHLSKGTEGRRPVERVTGSLAYTAQARTVLMAALDPNDLDGKRRFFVRAKSNLGPDSGGFEYQVENVQIAATERGPVQATRVLWGSAVDGRAEDLMASIESDRTREGLNACDQWLVSYLEDRGGSAPQREVLEVGQQQGFSERTIYRARSRQGVVQKAQGFGPEKTSYWSLPHHSISARNATLDRPVRDGKIGKID